MTDKTAIPVAGTRGRYRFPGSAPGLALSFGLHAAALAWCLQPSVPGQGEAAPPAESILAVTLAAPPHPSEPRIERNPAPQTLPTAANTGATTTRRQLPSHKPSPAPSPPNDDRNGGLTTLASGTSTEANEPAAQMLAARAAIPSIAGDAPGDDAGARSEDNLRLYSETVRALILAHRPGRARSRGTVELRFTLFPDGRIASAEIAVSGGSASLDQAAMDALREAAPFPPCPEAATAAQLTFSLPFQFR